MLTFPDCLPLRSFADRLAPESLAAAPFQPQRQGTSLTWDDGRMTIHSRWRRHCTPHWIVHQKGRSVFSSTPIDLSFVQSIRRDAQGMFLEDSRQTIHKQVDWVRCDLLRAIDHTARFAMEGLPVLRAVVGQAYPHQSSRIFLHQHNSRIDLKPYSPKVQAVNHALNRALKPWRQVMIEVPFSDPNKRIRSLLHDTIPLDLPSPSAHSLLVAMRSVSSLAWWPRYVATLAKYP